MQEPSYVSKARALGISVEFVDEQEKGRRQRYWALFGTIGAYGSRAKIVRHIWAKNGRATERQCIEPSPKRKKYSWDQERYWRDYGRPSVDKNLNDAGYNLEQRGEYLAIRKASSSRPVAAGKGREKAVRAVGHAQKTSKKTRVISEENALAAMKKLDLLDRRRQALARTEQSYWRAILLGGTSAGSCGLCGNRFPAELLVIAHIKKRSVCSKSEKLDRSNLMPMCKLGCDELFERGYVTVCKGLIVANPRLPQTNAVARYVRGLVGRKCSYWSGASAPYFEVHDRAHPRT